jgi:hypothetical protein
MTLASHAEHAVPPVDVVEQHRDDVAGAQAQTG